MVISEYFCNLNAWKINTLQTITAMITDYKVTKILRISDDS